VWYILQVVWRYSLTHHSNCHIYTPMQQLPMHSFHSASSDKMRPRIPHACVWYSCYQKVCNLVDEYAQAATVHCAASHLLRYMSRSQDSRTYASRHWNVSCLASCELTLSNFTNKSTTWSTWRASKVWKTPVMGRCSNDATSLTVIVTSPTERWKLLVSLCHISAKIDISPLSLVSKEHAIWKLNLVAATMSSVSRADLPNFSTFLPWEDNFNLGRSWK